jgi:hypothetical protein
VNWSTARSTVSVNFNNGHLHKNSHSNSQFLFSSVTWRTAVREIKIPLRSFSQTLATIKNVGPCHKVLNLSAIDSSEFKYGVSDSETTGKRMEMANGLQILKIF